jgi:hypothetical protein
MIITISKHRGFALDASAGNGKRFAGLFWKAWLRLPDQARAVLLTEWASRPPKIHLANDWTGRGPWEIGQCALDCRDLWFFAPAVDLLSPAAVQTLVAHEIAHAARYIAKANVPDVDREEQIVREITAEMGFDRDSLDREFDAMMRLSWRLYGLPDCVLLRLASALRIGGAA